MRRTLPPLMRQGNADGASGNPGQRIQRRPERQAPALGMTTPRQSNGRADLRRQGERRQGQQGARLAQTSRCSRIPDGHR
jgi:hypothetical protein